MKRDDTNIDEILKQYLPRASREDIEAAGETVLKRIREMRFQAKAAAAAEEKNFAITQSGREAMAKALALRQRAADRVRRPRFA